MLNAASHPQEIKGASRELQGSKTDLGKGTCFLRDCQGASFNEFDHVPTRTPHFPDVVDFGEKGGSAADVIVHIVPRYS